MWQWRLSASASLTATTVVAGVAVYDTDLLRNIIVSRRRLLAAAPAYAVLDEHEEAHAKQQKVIIIIRRSVELVKLGERLIGATSHSWRTATE